ncbi:MAG TPA: PAS domain-containing protein, partial [Conexibacter sp.]|nr:PAS domain-containing protein [Conexibacter sp.]
MTPFNRDLFERSRLAMSLLARNRTYLEVNAAMARMLEIDRDQLAGTHLNQFIPEGEQDDADAAWDELLARGHRLGERR